MLSKDIIFFEDDDIEDNINYNEYNNLHFY